MTSAVAVRIQPGTAGESTDAAIDRRLTNWGRWARGEGAGGGSCGSAEGNYRPPRVSDDARGWRFVDAADADLVEAAVSRLPEQERAILIACYVREWPPRRVTTELNLRWSGLVTWNMRLRGARIALGLRLAGRSLLRDRGGCGCV